MTESSEAEKEHDPSPQRLEEARRRGDAPLSSELVFAAVLAGLAGALVLFGPGIARRAGNAGMRLLSTQAGETAESRFVVLAGYLPAAVPLFLVPALAALAALTAQRAVVLSPERLVPKLERISPRAALARKLGREGLTDFGRSLAKLVLVSVVLGAFLVSRSEEVVAAMALAPGAAALGLAVLLRDFLVLAVLPIATLGLMDVLVQRLRFLRRNRMTRQEMIEEMRRSEGDPHLKAERRGRSREIATNRMLADVPRADVVIVNPTHFAVALRWDKATKRAPVCLAKGVDEVAARIRAAAAAAGVPLHRDPPTARALHASLEIGDEVRPDHYRAVAAAIRFAEAMRKRARGLAAR